MISRMLVRAVKLSAKAVARDLKGGWVEAGGPTLTKAVKNKFAELDAKLKEVEENNESK